LKVEKGKVKLTPSREKKSQALRVELKKLFVQHDGKTLSSIYDNTGI